MDTQTRAYRAEIARRLKAARWLAGGVREAEKGRVPWEVYALAPEDLARRPGMAENQLTASKIGSIERMERHTPPMELAVLARALGVSERWFTAPTDTTAPSLPALDALQQALADLGLVPDPSAAEGPAGDVGTDRPTQDEEDDAA